MRGVRLLGRGGSIGLFVFFAVLAVSCMLVPFSLGSRSLQANTNDRMNEVAQLTAQAIDSDLDGLRALVVTTGNSATFTGNIANDQDVVMALAKSSSSVSTSAFIDISGYVQASNIDATIGQYRGYRPYFVEAMANPGVPYVSDPFVTNVVAGDPRLVTASLAVVRNGVIQGVLVAGINLDSTVSNLAEIFRDSEGIQVTVFDRSANRVAGSVKDEAHDQIFMNRLRTTTDGRTSQTFESIDGHYVYALRPIGNSGLVIVATASSAQANSALTSFQKRMFVMAAVAGLGMLAGLGLLARSFRTRDQALRELRSSGERTRLIIDTAAQAFVECNESFEVTGWNVAAEKVFGWSADEALGKDMVVLITPDFNVELAREAIARAFERNADPESFEYPMARRGAKHPFPARFTRWVTNLHGEKRLSFFFEDITERHQYEAARELVLRRQRELVEELREADQTKSDFISTVSHELRTPLTSIVGYLEMLNEGFGGPVDKRTSSMLEVIDRNAQRLLRMIDDLLTLSRIESGQARTDATPVDMVALIESVRLALYPSTKDRKISFVVDVDPGLPQVMGDANQLERVLLNVLSNAIKFSPEGGSVTVNAWTDDETVRLAITDTGIGIPFEEQHKLFSRFFRSTTAKTAAVQGTGLGLAIVKSIVERHDGTIALQSTPDVGTVVRLTFPALGHDRAVAGS